MAAMADDEPKPDVLTSLPRTRPQRRSAKRDGAKPAVKAAPKASTPRAKQGAAKPARPATKPARPPRAVPRSIPPAGFAPPHDRGERPAPSGIELIGTAIQAAGELAQIGLAVGGQALRSALGRGNRD